MDFVSWLSYYTLRPECGANPPQSRLLAQHPEVQDLLRAECLALPSYGEKDLPTKDELQSMKYLANVIHEGQYLENRGFTLGGHAWLIHHSTSPVPISTSQHASSYQGHNPSSRRRP